MSDPGAAAVARRGRRWVALAVAATLVSGCASGPRTPAAYYVPAKGEATGAQDSRPCFEECRESNVSDDYRFDCMSACPGVVVAEKQTCWDVGESEYVACADRAAPPPAKKKRSKLPWALIAGIGAGVLCFVFINTSPLFRERSGK